MNVSSYPMRFFLLTLVACAHLPALAPEPRTDATRAFSAVRVESECGLWTARSGTGVIVSARHVLTAAHIVSCTKLPTVRVTYTNSSGEHRLRMVVTDEDRAKGIARLEIASAETFGLGIKPPSVRLPDPGDNVCASLAGAGHPLSVCGTVASRWTVVKHMPTRTADDGAPVYDDRGVLVGIVVNRGESDRWPYAWIAPIHDRWLDGIVPATTARGAATRLATSR